MDRDLLLTQLDRLRWALIRTLVAVLVAAVAGYAVRVQLIDILRYPLLLVDPDIKLHFLRLTEPFFVQLKVALFAGLFLVVPFIVRELWAALAPLFGGPGAARYTWPVTIGASLLFYAGAAFSFFFLVRAAVAFLVRFGAGQLKDFLTIGDYISFVMTLLIALGIMFEMPLILLMLGRVGIVTSRMLNRFRRYAIVLNAILSAVLTPTPDPFNMIMMMIPLAILYELSALLVRVFGKARAADASPAAS